MGTEIYMHECMANWNVGKFRCIWLVCMYPFICACNRPGLMHAGICVHACMHPCVCACMHASMCVACLCVCVHACMHPCVSACRHLCMHACACVCMHACVCVCMHACVHAIMCLYTSYAVHVCIHASMHTADHVRPSISCIRTHTHVQTHIRWSMHCQVALGPFLGQFLISDLSACHSMRMHKSEWVLYFDSHVYDIDVNTHISTTHI